MNIPTRYRVLFAWLIALLKSRQNATDAWIVNPAETINRQIASVELVYANFWRRNLVDDFIKARLQSYIVDLQAQRMWFLSMHIAAVGFIPRG